MEDGEEDDFRDRAVARIEPFIREQMVFRLRHRRSAASLSGLTLYPSFVMGLEESLWYTIASNKMDIRYKPFEIHKWLIKWTRRLVGLIGYPLLDDDFSQTMTEAAAVCSNCSRRSHKRSRAQPKTKVKTKIKAETEIRDLQIQPKKRSSCIGSSRLSSG